MCRPCRRRKVRGSVSEVRSCVDPVGGGKLEGVLVKSEGVSEDPAGGGKLEGGC